MRELFPNADISLTYGSETTCMRPEGQVTLCGERRCRIHTIDFLVVNDPDVKPALLSGRDAQDLNYLKVYAYKTANAVEEEPDPAKVDAITKMPMPTDKAGVQHFLGMCNYLSKFCHNLSETVRPLRDLTKENSTFLWSRNHENAFNSAKNLIASVTALLFP